jgi:hypothetical protein
MSAGVEQVVATLVTTAAVSARKIAAAAERAGREYDHYSYERLAEQLERVLHEADKRQGGTG